MKRIKQPGDEFVIEDINIKVIPTWKWLLVKN
jgi:hypothetical protein